jgi:hypothetical protein
LIFFAQFLHAGGRWARLLRGCPLHYHGNRGSKVVDVLGPAALSILCGPWRYTHINAVRGDTLNPPLLGMTGTVSEDVVRRAMQRIDERTGLAWLAAELRDCVAQAITALCNTLQRLNAIILGRRTDNCGSTAVAYPPLRSRSSNPEKRSPVRLLRTARPSAFFCPTSTTIVRPRVMAV